MRHYTDQELCSIIGLVISKKVTKQTVVDEMKFILQQYSYIFDPNESALNLFTKCCVLFERLDISNDNMIRQSLSEWGRWHGKSYQFRYRNTISDLEWIVLSKFISEIGQLYIPLFDKRCGVLRYKNSIRVSYRGSIILIIRMIDYIPNKPANTTFEVVFYNLTTPYNLIDLQQQFDKSKVRFRRIYLTNNHQFKSIAINFITFQKLSQILKIINVNEFKWLDPNPIYFKIRS